MPNLPDAGWLRKAATVTVAESLLMAHTVQVLWFIVKVFGAKHVPVDIELLRCCVGKVRSCNGSGRASPWVRAVGAAVHH